MRSLVLPPPVWREYRFWFEEIGSTPLDVPVEVHPRIEARRLAVEVHGGPDTELDAALAGQEEPLVVDDPVAVAHLVPGAIPAPNWSRLLLDAHAEGYGAVGGAIDAESRADRRTLAAYIEIVLADHVAGPAAPKSKPKRGT